MRRGRSQVLEGLKRLKLKMCQTFRTYCAHGFSKTPDIAANPKFGRCSLCNHTCERLLRHDMYFTTYLANGYHVRCCDLNRLPPKVWLCPDIAIQTDNVRFRSRVKNQQTLLRNQAEDQGDRVGVPLPAATIIQICVALDGSQFLASDEIDPA